MAEFRGFRITSSYGYRTHPIRESREFHAGVDLVKSHQAPIQAFTSGTVIYAGFGKSGTGLGGYGNVVLIRDRSNRAQLYAHMDSVAVKNGQTVSQDQVIGYQGATGFVTGSHMHFEVRKKVETAPPYGYRAAKPSSTLSPISYVKQFSQNENLKEKSNGTQVRNLQRELLKLGFNLNKYGADGVFGNETESAVKAFQRSEGIKVDGIVGPVTRARLNKNTTLVANYPGIIKRGSKGEIVEIIQRKVGAKIDGIFGPKTKQKVRQYQRRKNIKVDGIVGPETWQKLF
ncbi:Putative peptidoglycan binding domain-containing protein [Gracilibacillus orientalis]|uniref:Putative peptidoglycan binding domain-containing protein n=1 Tax=Gracilibacillus orientalis TaxID=334253 RepID=A0A1I4QUH1_9BACI|nr:peptidoglycan-binding protein [Gracilibacillus orientalis]SFM43353.1 Putative peptidoglycan binding domain-containing protein [Gracilibacillus orientalis]